MNKLRGGLKIAAAEGTGFGDRRKAMLQTSILPVVKDLEDLGMMIRDHGNARLCQEDPDHQRRDHHR